MADILLDVKVVGTQDVLKVQTAMARVEREAKKLSASMNQGRLTSQAYFKGQTQLVAVLTKAGMGYKEAQRAVFGYTKAQKDSVAISSRMGSAVSAATKKTSRMGVVAQQTGYQVGDFLVQIQSGANPIMAFGQQATQLAGVMTMFGGKLLYVGSALGILIPLATAIGGAWWASNKAADAAADSASDVEDAVSDLTSALSDYDDQVELSKTATRTLEEEFGSSALKMRELSKFLMEVSVSRALDSLSTKIAPFSQAIADASTEIESLDKHIKNVQQSITFTSEQKLLNEEAIETYQAKVLELADNLKLLPKEVRDLSSALGEISKAKSIEELRDTSEAALSLIAGMGYEAGNMPPQLALAVIELEKVFAATARSQAALDGAAESAGDFNKAVEDSRDAIQDLAKEIGGAAATLLAMEGVKIADPISDAVKDAANLAVELGVSLKDAYAIGKSDVKSGVVAAALAAKNLAKQLNISLRAALTMQGMLSKRPMGDVYDPRDPKFNTKESAMERTKRTMEDGSLYESNWEFPDPDASGGSGSKTDPRIAAQKAIDSLISSYDKEAAVLIKIKNAQADVNKAIELGVIGAQQGSEVMDAYTKSLEDAKSPMLDLANTAAGAFSDSFMSIVDGTKSVKDAFGDMVKVVIKKAFEMAVINPIINAIFGGIGGSTKLPAFGSTQADGGAWSGGRQIQAYADGGVVGGPTMFPMSGGKTGLMGEAGPEAIMPLKRGKNGKLGVETSGSGSVVVNNNFNIAANGDESVKRIIQGEMPKISEATKRAVVDSKRRGGSYGRSF